jgi:hypothetical protein
MDVCHLLLSVCEIFGSRFNFNRVKVTNLFTNPASDTNIGIDDMSLASFSGDGSRRAVPGANSAAGANPF